MVRKYDTDSYELDIPLMSQELKRLHFEIQPHLRRHAKISCTTWRVTAQVRALKAPLYGIMEARIVLSDVGYWMFRKGTRDASSARLHSLITSFIQMSNPIVVQPGAVSATHDPAEGVESNMLRASGRASVAVPECFAIHPRLQLHVKNRLSALDKDKGLDWATAEVRTRGRGELF